jgi:hypothetical protein
LAAGQPAHLLQQFPFGLGVSLANLLQWESDRMTKIAIVAPPIGYVPVE